MKHLPRALPADTGIDAQGILSFVEQLGTKGCHSVMVMRHNKVVAEGWWKPYQPQYNHMLYSLSKSFTSTAIGFAVQEGLLSIEDLVLSFFPEDRPAEPGERMKRLRIKHLLTMSTGHAEEPNVYGSDNWIRTFLASSLDHEPGSVFLYNTAATFMLSAIIQKVSGMTTLDYLTPRLFEPLDISDIWWEVNPQGINTGGFGLNIKTEDIAKFGTFLLNRGKWEGKQLLSAEWIDEASAKHIDNHGDNLDWRQGYGYQFWRCSQEGVYRGDGAFGQYCVVMPRQDAVVAITAGYEKMGEILEAIWSLLLPAMHDSVEPDEQAQAALQQRLATLEIAPPQGEPSGPQAAQYSDRVYRLEENPLKLTSLSFHFGPNESFTLWRGDESFTAQIGYGQWKENALNLHTTGRRNLIFFSDIACAGAWHDDVYTLKMIYTRTPHSDTFRVKFDDAGVTADFQRQPPPIGIRGGVVTLKGNA